MSGLTGAGAAVAPWIVANAFIPQLQPDYRRLNDLTYLTVAAWMRNTGEYLTCEQPQTTERGLVEFPAIRYKWGYARKNGKPITDLAFDATGEPITLNEGIVGSIIDTFGHWPADRLERHVTGSLAASTSGPNAIIPFEDMRGDSSLWVVEP